MQRITVTIPEDLVGEARHAVEVGEARSVSAYVVAALQDYRTRSTLRDLLDEWSRELGPVPADVAAEVDNELDELAGKAWPRVR